MEYLCENIQHFEKHSVCRLKDPDGNVEMLTVTPEMLLGGYEMPVEGRPFEYEPGPVETPGNAVVEGDDPSDEQ